MTSIIPSGELASLPSVNFAQANPQSFIDNILKSLSQARSQVANLQADLQNQAASLSENLSQYVSDIISLSPQAEKFLNSATPVLADNALGNERPAAFSLPAGEQSASLKVALNFKTISLSGSRGEDGSRTVTRDVTNFSFKASFSFENVGGELKASAKISLSYTEATISRTSGGDVDGTLINREVSGFNIKARNSFLDTGDSILRAGVITSETRDIEDNLQTTASGQNIGGANVLQFKASETFNARQSIRTQTEAPELSREDRLQALFVATAKYQLEQSSRTQSGAVLFSPASTIAFTDNARASVEQSNIEIRTKTVNKLLINNSETTQVNRLKLSVAVSQYEAQSSANNVLSQNSTNKVVT